MREIRQSGSEGGVEFKPPSLPLFYKRNDPRNILFVFQLRGFAVDMQCQAVA